MGKIIPNTINSPRNCVSTIQNQASGNADVPNFGLNLNAIKPIIRELRKLCQKNPD